MIQERSGDMADDSLKEMTEKVKEFCEARDWDQFHNPKDLAIGLSTEANELLSIFRFQSPEQITAMFEDAGKREHIEDELADALFFILRFAQMNDIDLAKCLDRKIERNNEHYPVEKAKGSNLKYSDLEGLYTNGNE